MAILDQRPLQSYKCLGVARCPHVTLNDSLCCLCIGSVLVNGPGRIVLELGSDAMRARIQQHFVDADRDDIEQLALVPSPRNAYRLVFLWRLRVELRDKLLDPSDPLGLSQLRHARSVPATAVVFE